MSREPGFDRRGVSVDDVSSVQVFSPLELKIRQQTEDKVQGQLGAFRVVAIILAIISLLAVGAIFGLAVYAAAERKQCASTNLPATWSKISPSGAWPHPRLAHAADGIGSRMYVHGGAYGSQNISFDDLWMYDETADAWEEIAVSGSKPSSRLHHCMVVMDDNTLLLFGGFNVFSPALAEHDSYADFYRYNIAAKEWTRLDTTITGSAPGKRGAHDCIWADGAMYVFGGFEKISAVGHKEELWKFTWATQKWTSLTPASAATPFPDGRIGFAWAVTGNEAILFGGGCGVGATHYNNGQCDDMWSYDWITNKWTKKIPTGDIPMARRATHGDASLFGLLFVYGGVHINGGSVTMLDDLYVYDPQNNRFMRVYPNHLRGEQPPKVFGHSLVQLGRKIVLFGGRVQSPASPGSNQLWEYHAIAPI